MLQGLSADEMCSIILCLLCLPIVLFLRADVNVWRTEVPKREIMEFWDSRTKS